MAVSHTKGILCIQWHSSSFTAFLEINLHSTSKVVLFFSQCKERRGLKKENNLIYIVPLCRTFIVWFIFMLKISLIYARNETKHKAVCVRCAWKRMKMHVSKVRKNLMVFINSSNVVLHFLCFTFSVTLLNSIYPAKWKTVSCLCQKERS